MKNMEGYAKVSQLCNKNQFVIDIEGGAVFQSYNSICAIWKDGKLTLGKHWDYSTTTSKHLYIFIEEYCYYLKTDEGYNLGSELRSCNNKRKLINKLIEAGIIAYDGELV